MTWLPLYSMGATHQNMKASLMRVKVGERLSWSKNNSDRNTMVSTSQYLGYEDYHEMSGLRSPEQCSATIPGAQGAGVLESLVSWEEQTQQNLGSIIVLTWFTHNIHHHYFYHKICLCHFTSVSYPIIKMRHLKGIVYWSNITYCHSPYFSSHSWWQLCRECHHQLTQPVQCQCQGREIRSSDWSDVITRPSDWLSVYLMLHGHCRDQSQWPVRGLSPPFPG